MSPQDFGVLHVVLSLTPGGTERLVVDMTRHLRADVRIAVCCLDEPGAWGAELQAEGTKVVALHRAPGFRPALGRRLAEVADRFGATVLHCHHYSPFVYGCLARAVNPKLRVLFTEHGRLNNGPPSRKRRLANRVLSRIPSGIFAVSHDLRRHLAAEGFPADAIDVVANGIDAGPSPTAHTRARALEALGVPGDGLVVGSVGRLNPVKDFATLLTAFSIMARTDPRWRLVLVGDGPERGRLKALAAADGLADRVHLTGYRADVREVLPGFDIFVNSSIFEGVSLTILEAMAAECPVVATAVGGTPEVVVDGATGLLVPPGTPEALAGALQTLVDQRALATEMGREGRRRVQRFFSIDRMVRSYSAVYAEQGRLACAA